MESVTWYVGVVFWRGEKREQLYFGSIYEEPGVSRPDNQCAVSRGEESEGAEETKQLAFIHLHSTQDQRLKQRFIYTLLPIKLE